MPGWHCVKPWPTAIMRMLFASQPNASTHCNGSIAGDVRLADDEIFERRRTPLSRDKLSDPVLDVAEAALGAGARDVVHTALEVVRRGGVVIEGAGELIIDIDLDLARSGR